MNGRVYSMCFLFSRGYCDRLTIEAVHARQYSANVLLLVYQFQLYSTSIKDNNSARKGCFVMVLVEAQSSFNKTYLISLHAILVPPEGVCSARYEKDDRFTLLVLFVAFSEKLRQLNAVGRVNEITLTPLAR